MRGWWGQGQRSSRPLPEQRDIGDPVPDQYRGTAGTPSSPVPGQRDGRDSVPERNRSRRTTTTLSRCGPVCTQRGTVPRSPSWFDPSPDTTKSPFRTVPRQRRARPVLPSQSQSRTKLRSHPGERSESSGGTGGSGAPGSASRCGMSRRQCSAISTHRPVRRPSAAPEGRAGGSGGPAPAPALPGPPRHPPASSSRHRRRPGAAAAPQRCRPGSAPLRPAASIGCGRPTPRHHWSASLSVDRHARRGQWGIAQASRRRSRWPCRG